MSRFLTSLLCFMVISTPALAREMPGGFADLVEKLQPAVVNISTTQKVADGGVQFFGAPMEQFQNNPDLEPFRDFFERFGGGQPKGKDGKPAKPAEREVTSLGSGFIIDASGYVITNNHVVDAAEQITVTLTDNTKYPAKVIGRDKKTDLALLKVESKKPLPFVSLGDSDAMRVGDWVIAIGNPFGLGGSVTQGIISARQRSINAGPYDDFLQTDAPINRGNSGGPLFNTNGEVIGINTAIFSPTGGSIGIGFAIPSALAKTVIEQLKTSGRTHRGWLGVKIQQVSDEVAESVGLAKAMGAMVLESTANGPAAKAGVQAGDIITHFDGKEISEMRFLPRMVADSKIGSTVPVTVWRKNKAVTLQVKVTESDDEDAATAPSKVTKEKADKTSGVAVSGMQLAAIDAELRTQYRVEKGIDGVLVVDVDAGSDAQKKGLKRGDVITEAGGDAVKAPEAVKTAIAKAKQAGRKNVLLKVVRGEDNAFVPLPVE